MFSDVEEPVFEAFTSPTVKLPPLNIYWTHPTNNRSPAVEDPLVLMDDVFAMDNYCELDAPQFIDIDQHQLKEELTSPFHDHESTGFYSGNAGGEWMPYSPCTSSGVSTCGDADSFTQSPFMTSPAQYGHQTAFQFPPCRQLEESESWAEDEASESVLHCRWVDCKGSYHTQDELVQHIERSHVDQRRAEDFTCFWAGCPRRHRPFNARYKLLIHMRVHSGEKPNRCSYDGCMKAFSRLENLKIHLRSHTGEKPYLCQYPTCRKTFSNSSDRAKHQRTHIDTKPYACQVPGCMKRYTDPSSLRKHVKNHVTKQALLDHHHHNHGPAEKSQPRNIGSNSNNNKNSNNKPPNRRDSLRDSISSYDSSPVECSWDNNVFATSNSDSEVYVGSINGVEAATSCSVDDSAQLTMLMDEGSLLFTEMNRFVQEENGGWLFPAIGDDMCGLPSSCFV